MNSQYETKEHLVNPINRKLKRKMKLNIIFILRSATEGITTCYDISL